MSRIIVKNLPKYITKDRLRQLFSVYGTITDTRMIYAQGDVFRRIAFVGYSDEDEAADAVDKMNHTYIDTCKISVEQAKSVNDPTLERPWSRYSKQSSAFVQSEKDRVERLKIIRNFKSKGSNPSQSLSPKDAPLKQLSKHETMILESCGIGEEDREQFNEYMLLNGVKPIESLTDQQPTDEKVDEEFQNNTSSVTCFTAKLSNLRPNIKLNRLLQFFKGLDVADIRILPAGERKKTCLAFVDFTNEADLGKAIKMSGKVLKGNTIRILESNSNKKTPPHGKVAAPGDDSGVCEATLLDTGRLFVANLPSVCDTADVKQLFENYGPVVDINMPTSKDTAKPAGYAFVTYMLPENAMTAFNHLNNFIFKGRLLRLIPAKSDQVDDFVVDSSHSGNSYKLKKMKRLKQINAHMAHTWNTLFINQNTVANILAKRLDITKEQLLLDPSFASNPAVSIAAGETALVNETKHFLEANGVNVDSFGHQGYNEEKSDCVLLAKNLPENVTSAQLMEFVLLKMKSSDESKLIVRPRIIMPPYGVTAIIKYEDSTTAKLAFKKLAFTKFRFTPLYLEWAPKETFSTNISTSESNTQQLPADPIDQPQIAPVVGCVVFVKNLNLSTTEETIKNYVDQVVSAVRVTLARRDPNNLSESLGYGFIEFSSANDAKECVKMLQGCEIDDSPIALKLSDRTIAPKSALSNNQSTSSKAVTAQTEDADVPKILVKNIPFEATRNDIMELFKTYGNVKSVRLPRKLSTSATTTLKNQHRGFAFIEFLTLEDAKYCFECMRYSTHLYGRRLVLEWANDSTSIANIRKRTAAHFSQDNSTAKNITSRITETLDSMETL